MMLGRLISHTPGAGGGAHPAMPGLPSLPDGVGAYHASGAPIGFDAVLGETPQDDVPADIAQLDALVAQMLAQALAAEDALPTMPAMQAETGLATWMRQALDGQGDAAQQRQPGTAEPSGMNLTQMAATLTAQSNGAAPDVVRPHAMPEPRANGGVAAAITLDADRAVPTERFNLHPAVAQATQATRTPGSEAAHVPLAMPRDARESAPTPTPMAAVLHAADGAARTHSTPTAAADTTAAAHAVAEPGERQKLIAALGERLSVQSLSGMRQAVIRLDPHLNGSVRIELRQEGNGLAVHLSATHADVVRQLQAIGDSLRHDLGTRHGGDVTVQVSASRAGQHDAADAHPHRDPQGGNDEQRRHPGRALAMAGGDAAFELASREAARLHMEST